MPRTPLLRPFAVAATLTAALLGAAAPPAAAYDIVGPGWQDPDITWRIVEYSRKDSLRGRQPAVEQVIAGAMREWEKAGRYIRFRKVRGGHADIEVRFVSRSRHPGSPFDGPGGIAAFGYFPPRGDLHFDDEENWYLAPGNRPRYKKRGLDLFQSAIHEVGHSLGFGHSSDPGSVMRADVANRRTLGRDDVRAVYELYGSRWGHQWGDRASARPGALGLRREWAGRWGWGVGGLP